MNTKNITDTAERKQVKRAARKKAAPKAKRAAGVDRGSQKKKVKIMAKGQRKR
jgi:activator of 2-hydroxyglutaryl-CoA dehydratase